MNARYLLDTSAASYAITKKSLAFDHHLATVPMAEFTRVKEPTLLCNQVLLAQPQELFRAIFM